MTLDTFSKNENFLGDMERRHPVDTGKFHLVYLLIEVLQESPDEV